MKKEDLFELCLEELSKGRSPQEVCSAPLFRAYEGELKDMLQIAADLRVLGESVPPRNPVLAASGRARLLAGAAKFRNKPERHLLFASIFPSFHKFRWSAVMALLVAIFLVSTAGHFVVTAAARSLPGDPLYPVKRLEERVTIALTLDEGKREALETSIQKERLREAKEVALKREVSLQLQGTVGEATGNRFMIGDVTVLITPQTRIEGTLEAGAFVWVRARADGKGHLLAETVTVKRVAVSAVRTVAPTYTPIPSPTGTASAVPTTAPVVVPPQKPKIPSATPTFTGTPSPTPTNTITPTATATPTETLTPMPPRVIWVVFSGVVQSMSKSEWKIGGRDVVLTGKTELRIEQGVQAEIGSWAIVEATKRPDGSWLARKIVITKSPKAVTVNLQGEILSISDTQWNVGGSRILVPTSASIHGTPVVGAFALVTAIRQPDGTLVAKEITIRTREEVTFEDQITSISSGEWTVGKIIVKITPDTQIDGTPHVGDRAQVDGWQNDDGSVEAVHIIVLAVPTPEPTDTPTKSAPSLTPSPTANPTEASQTFAPAGRTATPMTVPAATPEEMRGLKAASPQPSFGDCQPVGEVIFR